MKGENKMIKVDDELITKHGEKVGKCVIIWDVYTDGLMVPIKVDFRNFHRETRTLKDTWRSDAALSYNFFIEQLQHNQIINEYTNTINWPASGIAAIYTFLVEERNLIERIDRKRFFIVLKNTFAINLQDPRSIQISVKQSKIKTLANKRKQFSTTLREIFSLGI